MKNLTKLFLLVVILLNSISHLYSLSYEIKGTINLPNQLIMIQKLGQKGFELEDSIRVNEKGEFNFKGELNEETFCFIQFGSQAGVYVFLGNDEIMDLEINASDKGISYEISGMGVKNSLDLKNFVTLHFSYMAQQQKVKQYLQQLAAQKNHVEFEKMQRQGASLKQQYEYNLIKILKPTHKTLAPYFLYLFNQNDQLSLPILDSILVDMREYNPKHTYTRMLAYYISKEKITAIGSQAPIINLPDTSGKLLSLKSLRGKVVLVDFWATWCGPCIREVPKVRELYAKYKDAGFEIYGVSLDNNKARWKRGIDAYKMPWIHVSDLRGWGSQGAKMYDVHSIPAMFLLDKNGNIIYKNINADALAEILKQIYPQIK